MGVELTMLTYTVALFAVVIVIQAVAGTVAQGLMPMAGARDNLPPEKAFPARAKRVVQNHIEGLALFAPLVLIAAVTDNFNSWTALGAQLFFYSRVAHAGLYLFGVAWVRTVAFAVGVFGLGMILFSLFGMLK